MLALYVSAQPGVLRSVQEIHSNEQLFAVGAAYARHHKMPIKIAICDNLGVPIQPVCVCLPQMLSENEVH